MKIPAFHLQRIDMQVGDENIPRLDRRRPISRIRTARRSVGELVTATCRQFELPAHQLNCRCYVQSLSESDLAQYDGAVT